MKLIIFGGRDYDDYDRVIKEAIAFITECGYISFREEVKIISGACSDKKGVLTFTRKDGTEVYGADGLGERFADDFGYELLPFPADWEKFGRSAGPRRNVQMGKVGTHALGFPGGKGTKSMTEIAEDCRLVTKIIKE